MAVPRKKRASNNKWDKENMKLVACKIRADKAERFKQYAEEHGTTPNALLRGYIYTCIGEPPASGEESHKPAPAQSEGAESTDTTE